MATKREQKMRTRDHCVVEEENKAVEGWRNFTAICFDYTDTYITALSLLFQSCFSPSLGFLPFPLSLLPSQVGKGVSNAPLHIHTQSRSFRPEKLHDVEVKHDWQRLALPHYRHHRIKPLFQPAATFFLSHTHTLTHSILIFMKNTQHLRVTFDSCRSDFTIKLSGIP